MIIVLEFFQIPSTTATTATATATATTTTNTDSSVNEQEKGMSYTGVLEASSILELMTNSYQQLRMKDSGAYAHIFSSTLLTLPKLFIPPYTDLRQIALPATSSTITSTSASMVLAWKLRLPWFENILKQFRNVGDGQTNSVIIDSHSTITQG